MTPLYFAAPLAAYRQQGQDLLDAHRAGDSGAIQLFHSKHPRFLDENIRWLPKDIPDSEIQRATLTIEDAQLAIARSYDFQDWPALADFAEAVSNPQSKMFQFESAVEAVITGDAPALTSFISSNPQIVPRPIHKAYPLRSSGPRRHSPPPHRRQRR